MSIENQDLTSVEVPHALDPEHLWGGEEWEWVNWRNAHRDMNASAYNLKQIQEAVGIKTREAFMAEEHREPENDDELMQFFVNKGGARWIKRKLFQYRSDIPEADIVRYYEDRAWETRETNDVAKQV